MKDLHTPTDMTCPKCNQTYFSKHDYKQHSCTNNFTCNTCNKTFTTKLRLNTHTCSITYTCEHCTKTYTRLDHFQNHRCRADTVTLNKLKRKQTPAQTSSSKRTKKDNEIRIRTSNQSATSPLPRFPEDPKEGQIVEDLIAGLAEEEPIRDRYRRNWSSIRTHHKIGKVRHQFDFRWSRQENPDWRDWLLPIFLAQSSSFKINFAHSFMLFNPHEELEEDQYKFFYASENNSTVWEKPRLVRNLADMNAVIEEISNLDVLEHARVQRPDTKWTVKQICATSFYIYPLENHYIGACCFNGPLPPHIQQLKGGIKKFQSTQRYTSSTHVTPKNDNLCFF